MGGWVEAQQNRFRHEMTLVQKQTASIVNFLGRNK